ncbi:Protein RTF2 [Mitosporidium daphniae]|uniref:Uncharacterized protein n=1 Tax=Mitosporidium daphniae TaxID=1485682 RepID=A0A098VVZ1_9MICR|nr:uncharacterized protein DI09_110p50 [Mitosporidium daphniae]KGG53095.1 hypothetical protein DI09_110p50 [Mitosporidium daphniae]|eukprot:XP_013239531.1 uncharacterized protein DI09_110p50 [Mitosporidium daphniae]
MGADGGSIPKRCEMVKTAKRNEPLSSSAQIVANWTTCELSKEPLVFPVVSCRLGHLYSKSSILELLICRKQKKDFPFPDGPEKFSYIKSLKDLQNLSIKTDFLSYVCPVSGRSLNGVNPFFFIWGCGCIFSECILKTASFSTSLCPVCSHQYLKSDIVPFNPITSSSRSNVSRKIVIGQDYVFATASDHLVNDPTVGQPGRNLDYHPPNRSVFNTMVQQKLTSAKEISSINSIYTKTNKQENL